MKRALDTRDRAALAKYGRFLLPIAQRVAAAGAAADRAAGPAAQDLQQFIYGAFADVSRGTTCAPGGPGQ